MSRPLPIRAAVLAACAAPLFAPLSAHAFSVGEQSHYSTLALCYGQQAGAANAYADDLDQLRRLHPAPDAAQAERIEIAQAAAAQTATTADATAALYEDLDHPNYGADYEAMNAACFEGYAFWNRYLETPFEQRAAIPVTDAELGMSPACWQATFKLEAINKSNLDAGLLVWE